MFKIGVIGYGYWGPRIVRNFQGVKDCEVAMICDRNPETLKRAAQGHQNVKFSTEPSWLTPPSTRWPSHPRLDAL